MKSLTKSIVLCILLFSGGASATLIASDGGSTVYDTDLNIYWLSDSKLSSSNTFGLALNVDLGTIPGVNTYGGSHIYSNGSMTWGGALKWVSAMNAANYLGYNDWRLPTVTDTGAPGCSGNVYNGGDCGLNVNTATGEMAHLYYNEMGNKGYFNINGVYDPSSGLVDDPGNPSDETLFTNLQTTPANNKYWSGTEFTLSANDAYYFLLSWGMQSATGKDDTMFAFAVRSGDVATVPIPAAAWLFGSGLIGLIGVARRKALN